MRWYEDLYIGEHALKKSRRIIEKIKKHRPQRNVFVITEAFNGADLFDIYPANVLLWPYFKKKDYLIIGIAAGYDDAIGVIERIVKEVYCEQGITNLKEHFGA